MTSRARQQSHQTQLCKYPDSAGPSSITVSLTPPHRGINRRNGKQRSCEPCRKGKARCDHRIPVCRRCQAKGIADKCYYHPAPLTQSHAFLQSVPPSKSNNGPLGSDQPVVYAAMPDSATGLGQDRRRGGHRNSSGNETAAASTATTLVGPPQASGASVFPPVWPLAAANSHMASPQVLSDEPDKVIMEPVDEIQAADVLSRLADLELVQSLVRRWYNISQMCMLPPQFMEEILLSVRPFANRLSPLGTNLAGEVLHSTLRPIVFPPDTVISECPKLFTGPNLRLETVGLLLTTAGLAALKLPSSDPVYAECPFTKAEREVFAASMLAASNTCVSLCDKYFVLNDVSTWLRAEHLSLISHKYGIASK